MRGFVKLIFGSCLGAFLGLSLFVAVIVVLVSGLTVALSQKFSQFGEVKEIEINSILHLRLASGLPEELSQDPLDQIDLASFEVLESLDFPSMLNVIDTASSDPRIEGIFLDVLGVPGSSTTRRELSEAMEAFKKQGKWIVAHSDSYSMEEYGLCAVADELICSPLGSVELVGLKMEMLYFGKAVEKWGLDFQVLKARDNVYKSAVEPFSLEGMSDQNRQQLSVYLQDQWQHFSQQIERQRSLPAGSLDRFVEEQRPRSAKEALEIGVVDALANKSEVLSELHLKSKGFEGSEPRLISPLVYAKSENLWPKPNVQDSKKGFVAVLTIQGVMMPDEFAGQGVITPSGFRADIEDLAEVDGLKGLVLRIDSPGGDAVSAEVMWDQLKQFTNKVPVVVSMAKTVASGGYYLASAANTIVADPTTLTGSIGVFGMIPNLSPVLERHFGVSVESVETHPGMSRISGLSGLSDAQWLSHQRRIDIVYDVFLRRVAQGRGLELERLHELARGRLWSGVDAVDLGLADELGGLSKAISVIKGGADVDVRYMRPPSPLESVLEKVGGAPFSFMERFQVLLERPVILWMGTPWLSEFGGSWCLFKGGS